MALIESWTETIPGGSLRKFISAESTQTIIDSTPSKKAIVFRSGTKRRKPKPWLYPQTYLADYFTQDNGRGKYRAKAKVYSPHSSFGWNEFVQDGQIAISAGRLNDAPLPIVTDGMRDAAIISALLKLKDQKVNLAQAWAERRLTANLLTSSMTRMVESALLLRRGKLKEAWKRIGGNPRALPQTWLEYQYGWRPLMNDLYGSCEALADSHNRPGDWVITVKGAKNVNSRGNVKTYVVDGGPGSGRLEYDTKCGVFVRLDYEPDVAFLSQISSLGLTNPVQLAWELTPYSFVVDWFLQVGDYISSFDAAYGFKFRSGSKSERSEVVARFTGGGGTWNSGYANVLTDEYKCRKRHVKLDRLVYTESPLPRLPTLGSGLNLTRFANAASLLSQILTSGDLSKRRHYR